MKKCTGKGIGMGLSVVVAGCVGNHAHSDLASQFKGALQPAAAQVHIIAYDSDGVQRIEVYDSAGELADSFTAEPQTDIALPFPHYSRQYSVTSLALNRTGPMYVHVHDTKGNCFTETFERQFGDFSQTWTIAERTD